MKKYKLPEVPIGRSVLVIMLAFASFILGGYSEKASFTIWGSGAIVFGVAVIITTFYALMHDFWLSER